MQMYGIQDDAMTWPAAATTTASADNERRRKWWSIVCSVISSALFCGAFVAVMMYAIPMESFSVAIDSVSGLDDVLTDTAAAINPEFNLTLRVASGSYGRRACVQPSTYLEVSYRCAKLATTRAGAAAPLCAGPQGSAEQRGIVARGAGVRVPGYLLDSLAQDARRGAQVFGVTIRQSDGDAEHPYDHWVASCGGRRVGAALGGTCGTSYNSCSGRANTGVLVDDVVN